MKITARRRFPKVIIYIALTLFLCLIPLFNREKIAKAIAHNFDIVLFWRIRFEVLGQSPKGQHYIDLFDTHAREITNILVEHRSSLFTDSILVLNMWTPNLKALANGNGDDETVTNDQVVAVQVYLDKIEQWASPELKSTIATERAITPLEKTVGLTMNQAWTYLNQDPRFPSQSDLTNNSVSNPEPISEGYFHWTFLEFPNYSIDFDQRVWEFLSWNNGVAFSWEFANRSIPDCVMMTPKTLSDPYSRFIDAPKDLGGFQYVSRLSGNPDFIFYVIYEQADNPISTIGTDQQPQRLLFIVYPGYADSAGCVAQSEALISNIHFTTEHHK